jgi:lipoprotein-anchoring transpeptidase ErfK/SrfK
VPEPEAATDAAADAASPPATYTVVRGDYLSAIAARFGVSTAELIALNSLANPSLIHAGMVLTLPAGSAPSLTPDDRPEPTLAEGKEIVVVLTQQKVYAYENGELLQEYLVSTGLAATPTVQGDFAVYRHVPSQLMRGSDYYLPDVQWVLYFYRDYALHGTYWHSNFGHPMSHGCVNMRNEDAEWLYNWAPDGTSVRVIQ